MWKARLVSATAQVLGLLGVVLGAALSWGAGALNERARFRREQITRAQDRRLDAYAEFSSSTKRTMSVPFRAAAARGVDQQTEPLSLDDAKPLLAAAYHDREVAFEKVRLVGREEVAEAARLWVRAIYKMREAVTEEILTEERWSDLVSTANAHRAAFHEAARGDLGLS